MSFVPCGHPRQRATDPWRTFVAQLLVLSGLRPHAIGYANVIYDVGI
jgi:hypothetical protein